MDVRPVQGTDTKTAVEASFNCRFIRCAAANAISVQLTCSVYASCRKHAGPSSGYGIAREKAAVQVSCMCDVTSGAAPGCRARGGYCCTACLASFASRVSARRYWRCTGASALPILFSGTCACVRHPAASAASPAVPVLSAAARWRASSVPGASVATRCICSSANPAPR